MGNFCDIYKEMVTTKLIYPLLVLTAAGLLAGCATLQSPSAHQDDPSQIQIASASKNGTVPSTGTASKGIGTSLVGSAGNAIRTAVATTDIQSKLIDGAKYVIGKEQLNINGQSFPVDCSGVVRAIYWYAGIDLTKEFPKYSGNGVKRIHDILQDKDLLYESEIPAPGDIIFWDNTYDRNGDGLWNDPFTHCAVILSADRRGNIEYVHANYREGIIVEHMNLKNPDVYTREIRGKTVTVNSPMRMRGSPEGKGWLSSHLMRVFGMGHKLPAQ